MESPTYVVVCCGLSKAKSPAIAAKLHGIHIIDCLCEVRVPAPSLIGLAGLKDEMKRSINACVRATYSRSSATFLSLWFYQRSAASVNYWRKFFHKPSHLRRLLPPIVAGSDPGELVMCSRRSESERRRCQDCGQQRAQRIRSPEVAR